MAKNRPRLQPLADLCSNAMFFHVFFNFLGNFKLWGRLPPNRRSRDRKPSKSIIPCMERCSMWPNSRFGARDLTRAPQKIRFPACPPDLLTSRSNKNKLESLSSRRRRNPNLHCVHNCPDIGAPCLGPYFGTPSSIAFVCASLSTRWSDRFWGILGKTRGDSESRCRAATKIQ